MKERTLIEKLGFTLKEGANGVFIKTYKNNYRIEVDFEVKTIHFGGKIKIGERLIQNMTKPEDWVVLECVNRLLEKGYKPENIILEKIWPAGHQHSGRLDICVTRDDGSEYLLIECKTYGKEFDKALAKLNKDGGQLFTYFKFSNKADLIMLYASEMRDGKMIYRNEILKIEEDYRLGDVKDFYEKWNKLTKDNGVFEEWVTPYNFESKALTIGDLVEIKQEDSSFIFNRFLEILRHNVVSDKGNAFNRIFTLFLCKIYDEKVNEGTDNELGFQWLEGVDNHRSFQLRLNDLYRNGMYEFLEKVVTDFSETEFKNKFPYLTEQQREPILEEFRKIRLEKNNEFAIKDVYDEQSFNENAVVVKEIVQLLEKYQLRYAKKQQYLSDFFELLLTTGLKQESGQFFTPVPVAQFIIKSLPIDTFVEERLASAKIDNDTLLPYIIDYAAGSGHFLTEAMHEVQRLIDQKDDKKYHPAVAKKIRTWKDDHFAWAIQYIYGIEKDYRLVKVGKVGCYLHGDGLANVIHSDGLARFGHPDYKGKLLHTDKEERKDNNQFDMLVSNPPYSVSAFKNAARSFYKDESFDLYNSLTDSSSEIETLFVERTKQLLKDGGVAGIILPSSILSNTGIYSKAREIILQYFQIVGITELGSNTFMATGTNTVVLFLRRRNNYQKVHLKKAIEKFFTDHNDVTINGVEKPVEKYVGHVWENITFDDYVSLLKKDPNSAIEQHEIYKEYRKKIKAKSEADFWQQVLDREAEKLFYFVLVYPQKVVLIKSSQKEEEKRFLGYEFSNRRGSEGIHPIQRGKSISECTKLFDEERFDNEEKASTYIYRAFQGDFESDIHPSLQQNISRHHLVDMLTFNRAEFEKSISLSVKKKVKIESRWELVRIKDISEEIINGSTPSKNDYKFWDKKEINWLTIPDLNSSRLEVSNTENYVSKYALENKKVRIIPINSVLVSCTATIGKIGINSIKLSTNQQINAIVCNKKVLPYYLGNILRIYGKSLEDLTSNSGVKHVNLQMLNDFKIPLPPLDIQQKIVDEIEVLEEEERKAKEEIHQKETKIQELVQSTFSKYNQELLGNLCNSVEYGSSQKSQKSGRIPVIRMGNIQKGKIDWSDLVYTSDENEIKKYLLKEKDVLFNRTNSPELVGKVGIYKGEKPAIYAGYLIRINCKTELLNPVFLANILNSKVIRDYGFSVMSKSVNQANINGTKLKAYKIPLLPLSEQQKIVSEIEKIEAQIEVLEKELAQIPSQKEAVLKKYL